MTLPRLRAPLFLAISTCLSYASVAAASPFARYHLADRYLGIIVASDHIGSNHSLNGTNPGLTYGADWANPGSRWWLFAEGGVFYNSYREISPIFLAGLSTELGHLGPVRFRIGGGIGMAYYKTLSVALKKDYSIPNIAGFIPIAAASLVVEYGKNEIRLTTVPAGQTVNAIVNLSFVRQF